MARKAGAVLMALGAALVVAALGLFVFNQWQDHRADAAAASALAQVAQRVGSAQDEPADAGFDPAMAETMVDGYAYIGYLTLPTVGLELPVMSDCSEEQLKLAPCRYYGSTKTDDLVVAGHNYTRHFGPLENLQPGDAVYFTAMDGTAIAYQVAEIDVLGATAVEEMTDSGYALTLFTCNYSGQDRVTVRCDRVPG